MNTAVRVLNATGTNTVVNKTPYELWNGKKANIEHLKSFGADVYIHIPKQLRRKWDRKAIKCVFVGYGENVKGFRVWNPSTNKIEFSRDVIFCENSIGSETIVSIDSTTDREKDASDGEDDASDGENDASDGDNDASNVGNSASEGDDRQNTSEDETYNSAEDTEPSVIEKNSSIEADHSNGGGHASNPSRGWYHFMWMWIIGRV